MMPLNQAIRSHHPRCRPGRADADHRAIFYSAAKEASFCEDRSIRTEAHGVNVRRRESGWLGYEEAQTSHACHKTTDG